MQRYIGPIAVSKRKAKGKHRKLLNQKKKREEIIMCTIAKVVQFSRAQRLT